jgi:hypothetical protein
MFVRYRVFDLWLESAVDFPELRSSRNGSADLKFTMAAEAALEGVDWYRSWPEEAERPWAQYGRAGTSYVVRFPEADFRLNAAADQISCYAQPGVEPNTIRHLFLDQIVPLSISHAGRVVLHGSAVATPAGALAFIAPSGSGKSTLAATFSRHGMNVLTDDAILITDDSHSKRIIPSYHGLRLWPDVLTGAGQELLPLVNDYSNKRRLGRSHVTFSSQPADLGVLYVISEPDDKVRFTPFSSGDAMIELLGAQFQLDTQDPARLRAQFEAARRLASSVPVFRLHYPRSLGALDEVAGAILAHATAIRTLSRSRLPK